VLVLVLVIVIAIVLVIVLIVDRSIDPNRALARTSERDLLRDREREQNRVRGERERRIDEAQGDAEHAVPVEQQARVGNRHHVGDEPSVHHGSRLSTHGEAAELAVRPVVDLPADGRTTAERGEVKKKHAESRVRHRHRHRSTSGPDLA
jgi:hypothetical protein